MNDITTIFFYIIAFAPVILIPIIGFLIIKYYLKNSEKIMKRFKKYIIPKKYDE